MASGNFNKALCWNWLMGCLLCSALFCRAQEKISNSKIDVAHYQKQDDVENFIYHIVDEFLANPSPDRLALFQEYEKHLWRPLKTESEFLACVTLLCNKGYYSTHFGVISEAVDAYERAWEIYKTNSLTGFDLIEYCLKPLGNNYLILGDYSSAENIIKQYLLLAEQEKNQDHIVSAFINLSILYHITARFQEAIDLLTNAMNMKAASQKKGLLYSNLAANFLRLNDLENARKNAQAALIFFQKFPTSETAVNHVNVYKILSRISIATNDFEKAFEYLRTAQGIASSESIALKNREIAKLQNDMADLLRLMGQHQNALLSYQQALKTLLPNYKPQHNAALPDQAMFYAENAIKESLDGMALVYRDLNESEKAIACYDLSFGVEDLLRDTYNYQDSKLQQQVEDRNRTCQEIFLLSQLANKYNAEQHIRKAFQLAERSKALVLKEAIERNYRRYQAQHDSLFRRESFLVNKKARLANDIALEQLKGDAADITKIDRLLELQMQTTVEWKALQKRIEQKYPETTSSDTVDIAQLQRKLGDNAVLFEYIADKDSLYVFCMSKQSLTLQRIENAPSVYNNVRQLRDMLYSPSTINNDIEMYKQTAFDLYKALHLPEAKGKELIIIPDGILSTIPFDVLLSEKVDHNNYSTFPYLLKKFKIVYQPTAALYAKTDNQEIGVQNVFGIFPVFENTDQSLPYSKSEAENMKKYFDGKYLMGPAATKKEFLDNASRYSILHLSTHATAGSFMESPSIQFSDSTLYLNEIYGLQIRPSLVVASACDMGIGKLSKGEGALSLARGFQYAGAKNIIFSLWKINDYATAQVISKFYERFYNTGSEAESLQQAKIDYLESEDIPNARKSPYYWGAFIYYGEITDGKSNPFIMYAILLMLIGVSVVVFLAVKVMRKRLRT